MTFEIPKTSYSGKIEEVKLGKGDKAVTVGGETAYPFYLFEGEMPNLPKIAMEVWDCPPEEWAEAALEPFQGVRCRVEDRVIRGLGVDAPYLVDGGDIAVRSEAKQEVEPLTGGFEIHFFKALHVERPGLFVFEFICKQVRPLHRQPREKPAVRLALGIEPVRQLAGVLDEIEGECSAYCRRPISVVKAAPPHDLHRAITSS